MMQQGHLTSDVLRRYREGVLNSELMRAVKVFLASNPLYADAAEGIDEVEDEAALEASLALLDKSREKLLKGRGNVTYIRFEWIQRAALLAAAVAMIGITTFVVQRIAFDQHQKATFADLKQENTHVTVAAPDSDAMRQAQAFERQPIAAGKRSQPGIYTPLSDGTAFAAPAEQEAPPPPPFEAATDPTTASNDLAVQPISAPVASASKPTAPPAPIRMSAPTAQQSPRYERQREEAPVLEERNVNLQAEAEDDAAGESPYNQNGRPLRAAEKPEAKQQAGAVPAAEAPARTSVAATSPTGPTPETAADLLFRAEQFLAKQDTVSALPLLERAAKLKGAEAKKAAELLKKLKK